MTTTVNPTPTTNTSITTTASNPPLHDTTTVTLNDSFLSTTNIRPNEFEIGSIAKLNMPVLDKRNIEGWFLSLSYWFPAMNIRSDTQKFNTVMAALDPKTLQDFSSILGTVPEANKYDYVSKKLTVYCTESQQRRLNQLLNDVELGDRRPSQMFNEMTRLAGDSMNESAVKNIWMKRLPVIIQAAVAATTGPSSEYLKIADAIHDTVGYQVNSINTSNNDLVSQGASSLAAQAQTNKRNDIDTLCDTINQLTKKVDQMWNNNRNSRSKKRENSTERSRSRSKTPAIPGICWYHRKHGKKSNNCRPPCKFEKDDSSKNDSN